MTGILTQDRLLKLNMEISANIDEWKSGLLQLESRCPLQLWSYIYFKLSHQKHYKSDATLRTYSFLGENTELKHDEIIDYKQAFVTQLDTKLAEAYHSGKKLLVVMGESHNTQHSYFFELMIGTILKTYGFSTLMIERESAILPHNQYSTYPYIASTALGYKLMPINSKSHMSVLRNFFIDANIATAPSEHSLCQVGANHIKHIISSQSILKKFVVFPVNVAIAPEHIIPIKNQPHPMSILDVPEGIYCMHTLRSIEGFSFGELIKIYRAVLPELLNITASNDTGKIYTPDASTMNKPCPMYNEFKEDVELYLSGEMNDSEML